MDIYMNDINDLALKRPVGGGRKNGYEQLWIAFPEGL